GVRCLPSCGTRTSTAFACITCNALGSRRSSTPCGRPALPRGPRNAAREGNQRGRESFGRGARAPTAGGHSVNPTFRLQAILTLSIAPLPPLRSCHAAPAKNLHIGSGATSLDFLE